MGVDAEKEFSQERNWGRLPAEDKRAEFPNGFKASNHGLTASARHPIPVQGPSYSSAQSHDFAGREEVCLAPAFLGSPKLFCSFKFL